MKTAERLTTYYNFSDEVLGRVAAAAERQNAEGVTFEDLAAQYGVENGPRRFVPDGARKPIEVLQFTPAEDHDKNRIRVYHTPMGNPIDRNMTMRSMRLFAADPSEPLLVVGNPSSPGRGAGKMSLLDSLHVARSGSLRPVVDPLLRHLHSKKTITASQLGFSYGADKAVAVATHATEYGIGVPHGVFVEPASAQKTNLIRLGRGMLAAFDQLDQYVAQSESPPYQEVRNSENRWTALGYGVGLLRISNLAIGLSIARGDFSERVESALQVQTYMNVAVGWGTKSELADNPTMHTVARTLMTVAPARVEPMRIDGMHHLGSGDIDLHAAIMLEGMRA